MAALRREVLDVTCQDAAQDQSTAALVDLIKVQNLVIERQNAQHILNQQVHGHLRTQLANRDMPCEHRGAVLKHGYGALDAEAEAAEKRAEEEEKQRQKEQEREERQQRKDEAAIAKATRAAEVAQ